MADVADRITTALLITSPEGEQFWPGQSEQLAALTAGVSTIVRFTAVEGANEHCQPLARTLTAQRIFDWLDDRIEESGRVKTGIGIDAGQVHGVPGGL
jgi:hypothetical protein